MSFAAMGCRPGQTWARADGSDGPGASPGDLAYSSDSGVYLCVKAQGAVTQYDACVLQGIYEAKPATDATAHPGTPVCVPQTAIADNHYGWGLVAGKGRVRTDGGVPAGRGYSFNTPAGVLDVHGGSTGEIGGMYATEADGSTGGPMICMFPSVLN